MDNLNHNQIKEIVLNSLIQSKKTEFLIALSGGIDSTLLLNMVNEICQSKNYKIRAVHINHNISKDARLMHEHCIDICKKLKINLIVKKIEKVDKSNIEENLRNERYKLMFDIMNTNEALLLGHHNDDQIETFLYRLFRGSSPYGLSCMNTISSRNDKILCRPFLCISKEDIINIGTIMNLNFINDNTNNDVSFDRNYIRKEIIPKISNRWKSINNVMHHNISLQSDYSKVVTDYCNLLYPDMIVENKLDIIKLKGYPLYFESIFLKHWLKRYINYDLSKNEIEQIKSIINTNNNDYPEYKLRNGFSVIRYKDFLHINKPMDIMQNSNKIWDMRQDIDFGILNISLNRLKEKGLYQQLISKAPVVLKFVEGKEKIMLNNNHYQDLKKVFQSNSVPVWERDKFVLFFSNSELLLAYGENHMFISSELR
tara:strand:+ start:16822 stop:18102 length:1281 start_codon:yes stop_codon:yes gene_type:complete